jgi:hypothetical protein
MKVPAKRNFDCPESGEKCTDPRCTITLCYEQILNQAVSDKKHALKAAHTWLPPEIQELVDYSNAHPELRAKHIAKKGKKSG